jgi:hypothetical protein
MSYPRKLEVAQEWQRTANLSSGKPQTIENKLKFYPVHSYVMEISVKKYARFLELTQICLGFVFAICYLSRSLENKV